MNDKKLANQYEDYQPYEETSDQFLAIEFLVFRNLLSILHSSKNDSE